MFLEVLYALAPIVFLILFIHWRGMRGEPHVLIGSVFYWGMASIIPVAFIELGVYLLVVPSPDNSWSLVGFLLLLAMLEECAKFYVVKRVAYNHIAFDTVLDGLAYGLVAGLGFATLENIAYVMRGGVEVAIVRAISAIPSHALWGGISGLGLGFAKFHKSNQYIGLVIAIIAHTIHNGLAYWLVPQSTAVLVQVVIMLGIAVQLFVYIKRKGVVEGQSEVV